MEEDILFFNYIIDLRKKEISCFDRAKIIRRYLDSNKISIRELGRKTGIARSTIEDWLRWDNISAEDYNSMKEKGLNDTEIYRHLRLGDETKEEKVKTIDIELQKFIKTFAIFTISPPYSEQTTKLIDDAIIRLNKIKKNIIERQKKENA